jgi:hypothetical protein
MTHQQTPRPVPAAPVEQATQFLGVFADWLVRDARPLVVDQVSKLRELSRSIDDATEVDHLVAHLEDVVLRLDHLAATIVYAPQGSLDGEVETLAADVADRCCASRVLMEKTRLAIAAHGGGDGDVRERAGAA